ncbi:carboxypeptidase-like regulatory domain-containing protein [Pedobacter sp. ASV28]|uniref:carboxypeptidase-like regulatory domain-containing protein n=1 Tax=Pedobacter sp. ASV28 TaxID=2795123 RepID=UPI0018EC8115|nr:carboxypeptidase-like regulatory domain-containing protein [Pedobacter sp. ASV28]
MKKNLFTALTIVIMVLTASCAFGQSVIFGLVKNKANEGLLYANIGIKGGKIGTVSTTGGKFSISIPDSLLKDSITFSSIGYEDKSFLLNSLINKKNIEIVLDEKVISLAEVKISNGKLKLYKLGITGRTPMVSIPTKSYQKDDILEQARLIHLKKAARLLDANIFV